MTDAEITISDPTRIVVGDGLSLSDRREVHRRLGRQLAAEGAWHALVTAGCFWLLLMVLPVTGALGWLVLAGTVLIWIHIRLHRQSMALHLMGSTGLQWALGGANRLTLARGLFVSFLAGFILVPERLIVGGTSSLLCAFRALSVLGTLGRRRRRLGPLQGPGDRTGPEARHGDGCFGASGGIDPGGFSEPPAGGLSGGGRSVLYLPTRYPAAARQRPSCPCLAEPSLCPHRRWYSDGLCRCGSDAALPR